MADKSFKESVKDFWDDHGGKIVVGGVVIASGAALAAGIGFSIMGGMSALESLPEGASFFQKYTAFNIGGKSAGGLAASLIIGGGLGIGGIVAAGKKLKGTFQARKRKKEHSKALEREKEKEKMFSRVKEASQLNSSETERSSVENISSRTTLHSTKETVKPVFKEENKSVQVGDFSSRETTDSLKLSPYKYERNSLNSSAERVWDRFEKESAEEMERGKLNARLGVKELPKEQKSSSGSSFSINLEDYSLEKVQNLTKEEWAANIRRRGELFKDTPFIHSEYSKEANKVNNLSDEEFKRAKEGLISLRKQDDILFYGSLPSLDSAMREYEKINTVERTPSLKNEDVLNWALKKGNFSGR